MCWYFLKVIIGHKCVTRLAAFFPLSARRVVVVRGRSLFHQWMGSYFFSLPFPFTSRIYFRGWVGRGRGGSYSLLLQYVHGTPLPPLPPPPPHAPHRRKKKKKITGRHVTECLSVSLFNCPRYELWLAGSKWTPLTVATWTVNFLSFVPEHCRSFLRHP